MLKKSFLILVLFLSVNRAALAFWIWTPETNRWTNPKYAARETPLEQLNFAKGYYDIKDYPTALREFRKLVKYYPDAIEAPEAQYYSGLCLEELDKYYEAYQAHQKVIEKYPFSPRTEDVLEREYAIGLKLLDYKKKLLGFEFTGENAAVEIFQKIIENAPYGKYAAASQYKIGLTLKGKAFFREAIDAFQKVLDNHPESEWVEPAKFQIALCASKSSLDPKYDQTLTQEAQEKFKTFVKTHPEAELSSEAQKEIEGLKDKEAEYNYDIAQFYEKQKAYGSAKIYYRFVIKTFPGSPWASKAQEKLQRIERERL